MSTKSKKTKRTVGKGKVSASTKTPAQGSGFSLNFSHKYKKTSGGDVKEGKSTLTLNLSKEKDQPSEPFYLKVWRFLCLIFHFFYE
jgi:hypothetical protein